MYHNDDHTLLSYFHSKTEVDSQFSYQAQVDEDMRITSCFWVHGEADGTQLVARRLHVVNRWCSYIRQEALSGANAFEIVREHVEKLPVLLRGIQQESQSSVDTGDNLDVQYDPHMVIGHDKRNCPQLKDATPNSRSEHIVDVSIGRGRGRGWLDGGSGSNSGEEACSRTESRNRMEKIEELESDFGELVGCVSDLKEFQVAETTQMKLLSQAELR
ncbi:hypothetical protein ACLOJK_037377 [Asimina triloba]